MKEVAINVTKFKPNRTTFLLKTKIESFSTSLTIKKLNTLFNLPAGFEEIKVDYDNISTVTTSRKHHKNRIVFGIIMILLGLIVILNNILIAALGILFGVLQIANCNTSEILIKLGNGHHTLIEVASSEKQHVNNFLTQLYEVMNKSKR